MMAGTDARTSARPFLLTARGFALASVAVFVVLFLTAGTLVQDHRLEDVHGGAAIALHVVTGGLMTALAGFAYSRGRGWWAAVVAGVVFVYSFVQASLGDGGTLNLHIPGALIVVGATVWLTAWLFSPSVVGGR